MRLEQAEFLLKIGVNVTRNPGGNAMIFVAYIGYLFDKISF